MLTSRQRGRIVRYAIYAVTLAVVAWAATSTDWAKLQEHFFDPKIFWNLFPDILTRAARNTLIFTFFGFTGGLAIGLVLALMRLSPVAPYRWAATVYIEVFRGLPALITIVLIGFVLPIALQVRVPGTYGPGSLALAIVTGAYLAETIRAGIEAVPKGQMEAARSLGLSRWHCFRHIIFPQALRTILPPLGNDFVSMVKDSALVSALGVQDITQLGKLSASSSFLFFETYNVVAFLYLTMTISLSLLVRWLERVMDQRVGR